MKTLPQKKIDLLDPDKVETLIEAWRQGCIARKAPIAHITVKARGQFKYLLKIMPAGKAPAIVRYVTEIWGEFRSDAEKVAGAFNSPTHPVLGYLVKYQAVAVKLWEDELRRARCREDLKLSAQRPVPVRPTMEHVPATFEETVAILNGLDP